MLEECRLRPPRSAVNSARIGLLLFVPLQRPENNEQAIRGNADEDAHEAFETGRTAPGRHQPGWRRAAAAVAGAGGNRGHPIHQAGSASHLAVAAQPAEPQAAQARRRRRVGCGAGTACAIPGRTTARVARRIGHFGGTDALAEAACDALRLIGARRALRAAASRPASRVRFPKPVATGAERIP